MAAVAASGLAGAGGAAADPGTPGCNPDPAGDFTHTIPAPQGPPQLSPIGGTGIVVAAMAGADRKAYDYGVNGTVDPLLVSALFCEQGVIFDAPYLGAVANSDIAQIFALGTGKIIYYRNFSSSGASGWLRVPHSFAGSGPIAMVTATRTDIFYISGNAPNNIYHHVYVNGHWLGPEKLGGAGLGRVSGYRQPNGSFRLWLTGTNHRIYTMSGTTGHWSGWKKLSTGASLRAVSGTIGFDPAAQRHDLFAVGTNGGLYHAFFTNNMATFSGWRRLAVGVPNNSDVSAAAAGPSHMLVYVKIGGSADMVYDQYVNGHWTGLAFLAPYTCPLCAPTPPAATASPGSRTRISDGAVTAPAPKMSVGSER